MTMNPRLTTNRVLVIIASSALKEAFELPCMMWDRVAMKFGMVTDRA
jgi:hypothetical protein